jgi:histidyl-tRNA synthetase
MTATDRSKTTPIVTPRTLKGFRDHLPETMIPRERLIATAQKVYRSYGFLPIDTPALEYLEILDGKGGEESQKQLYKFEDHGGRQVGLRFDLTVPLARFVAQHAGALGFPFKRYHIGTVWRGENTSRGRYREFMQCDFDTIGSTSAATDIETALVIHDLMQAIGLKEFTIRVNNRQVLNGLLEKLDLAQHSTAVLRCLDKLGKIGPDEVIREMTTTAGLTEPQAREVLRLAALEGNNDSVLQQLDVMLQGNEKGEAGVARLREILSGFASAAHPDRIQLDVSIARGLDYYTGPIFETFLDPLPGIGSVCSGGRYDDLAGLFTRQQLPGIGASLGLDRLLAAQEELGLIEKVRTVAPIFIPYFAPGRLEDYLRMAAWIRSAGWGVEVFPECKKLGAQLKYADRRGFRLALIAGEDELDRESCQIKDLRQGGQRDVSLAQGGAELLAALADTDWTE